MDTPTTTHIPDRSSPGSTRTARSAFHQDRREKCDTGANLQKIRGRDLISLATWNVRTLAQTGKLHELTHELKIYTWHIVGLCEMRWKNFGEHQTEEGHVLYYSGELDTHANGVGFLVNKSIKNAVLGCCPVSSRIITIKLQAAPFNITIIQVYVPTSEYDDEHVETFYTQLQEVIDKVKRRTS
ncbi:craniofacial development protein 2-like [Amphiura filiformis]|uniref:craniofacial development protein 2-like n=1 Tax=Amphiura filiformis TaxID=82378 RepID=UPI003B2243C2